MYIKVKTAMGIAIIFAMLLSSIAVVAATPPMQKTSDVSSSGYSTYIVAFNGEPGQMSAMAEEKVTSLVNSYEGQVVYRYSVINGMAVTIPDDRVNELKALDNVKYVEKDQEVTVLLDKAVPQINAPDVWAAGYTGKGVKVCVIDTGIDASHPDLNGNKVVAWVDYVKGQTSPYDDHGHGTHCSSTIAGTGAASSGQYKGVAPEASLMGCKVLGKDGSGSNSNIIKGIDWAVKNGAQVISMSLGSSTHSQASDDAVNNAVKAGVTVVVAAGNSGPSKKTVACPGDCESALTVGASDRNDQIASFSSRGPTYDGRVKPDVTNMGVGLVAAKATGTSGGKPVNQYYTAMSGTSMATPMTAGTVALLLQAKPDMTPAQVKNALTKTAKPLGSGVPNTDYGYGRVQAKAAIEYILNGQLPPAPSPTPTPTPGPNPTATPTATPTPNPEPGSYAVSLMSMFARYDGHMGRIEQFKVAPGTTVDQNAILGNVGKSPDSYTITVDGIPSTWYKISKYSGETIEPSASTFMSVLLTPAADAKTGYYKFTVTAKSKTDPSVSDTESYTLSVVSPGGPAPTPTPNPTATPTPTPGPNPTATPVPTPTPAPGTSFSGTTSLNNEYYTYIVPTAEGTISAQIAWNSYDDLNMYLYDSNGKLVAKSESRYTRSESVNFNAPKGGYYLLKVSADRSYRSVEFTGTSNHNVYMAYVKSGSLQPGQAATMKISSDGIKNINARLIWAWSFYTPELILYDPSGKEVARGIKMIESFSTSCEQLNYKPAVAGTYTIKVDGTQSNSVLNYKLITPYQL
ncbi:peptidase S8 [Methanocella sp. CWC-04]|uniref:Peptidase S8 n=1 Tax=Methanooceanicella nereidis TaxID=2052831 RepID=A0AAP2RHH5_9EURY|nr:S8 family serine peptidase [Methanocella sp. CWC-04]MCD1296327.1 peptidase S8 [Methanocella sp. CWC-04]